MNSLPTVKVAAYVMDPVHRYVIIRQIIENRKFNLVENQLFLAYLESKRVIPDNAAEAINHAIEEKEFEIQAMQEQLRSVLNEAFKAYVVIPDKRKDEARKMLKEMNIPDIDFKNYEANTEATTAS